MPALAAARSQGLGAGARAAPQCGELGLLGLGAPEGVRRPRSRQGVVAGRRRADRALGVVCHHVRRPGQPVACCRSSSSAPRRRRRSTCRASSPARSSAPTRSASPAPGPTRWRAKTRATKQPDGSWSLIGEKMWISNGGFADLFIVFAKVDGEQFTAFIVERALRRRQLGQGRAQDGPARLVHDDRSCCRTCRVPADNVLGEIGRGHKVALNTLNYGRFSLGAMCAGGAAAAIGDAAQLRGRPQAVRPADRGVRRHQAQAGRDDGAHLRRREPGLSHGRAHRRRPRAVGARRRRRSPRRSRSSPSRRRSAR